MNGATQGSVVVEPDWLDLNDWIALNHPAVHSATKYLSSISAQRRIWLIQWRASGCPDICQPAYVAAQNQGGAL